MFFPLYFFFPPAGPPPPGGKGRVAPNDFPPLEEKDSTPSNVGVWLRKSPNSVARTEVGGDATWFYLVFYMYSVPLKGLCRTSFFSIFFYFYES